MKSQIILSKKQHNRILPKRKWKWSVKHIITDDKSKYCMEMHQYVRGYWKLLIWFCFPIALIVGFPIYIGIWLKKFLVENLLFCRQSSWLCLTSEVTRFDMLLVYFGKTIKI